MTNRKHNLPLVQQCKALAIHRTTIYRESKPVKQRQLDLMKLIDRIHMDDPAWGCRKVREYLIELGHPIGRRHCTTLFRKLGIHCIYGKPRTLGVRIVVISIDLNHWNLFHRFEDT